MRVTQKKINKNLQKETLSLLFQVVADICKPEETKIFLESILTPVEVEAVAKRLAIGHYLDRGRSYQNIKDNLKVSSATIATVDKIRKLPGFQLALKKIDADRWATEWAGKIEKLFGKK